MAPSHGDDLTRTVLTFWAQALKVVPRFQAEESNTSGQEKAKVMSRVFLPAKDPPARPLDSPRLGVSVWDPVTTEAAQNSGKPKGKSSHST